MKYVRFFFVLALLIACVPSFAADAPSKPQLPQRAGLGIAAIVNNDIITTAEVQGRVGLALQGAQMKPDPKILDELEHQALEALIDEQIRIQEAKRLGVMPAKEEIDEAFTKIAKQNNMQPEQFNQILGRVPGVKESLYRQLQTQAAWSNVIKKKIRPQVNITETDITNYLTEKEKNVAKVEYQVAEIFLRDSDSNKELAQSLVAQLKSGKQRFSVLARQFSQGLEASKGGMLGWIPEGRLEAPLEEKVKTTTPGQITDPIQSSRGIHILLIRDKRDILATKEGSQKIQIKQAVVPVPPQAPPEYLQKAEQQALLWKAEAKDCDAMDALIKKINSPLSRDLGLMRLAELPPPVTNATKNLAIGQASDPIRATDGLAIMMVCKREESSTEIVRDDVANVLGTERLNRLQYRYYRDLRSAAYVDIK